MKNPERMLYQNNNKGYLLVIAFIVFNTIYTVFVLNAMDKDRGIGIFVMLTIALLLLGFLTAIKVRTYSLPWSIAALVMGLFQFSRLFFTTVNFEGTVSLLLNLTLILSSVLCVAGGALSLIYTLKRHRLK